MRHDDAILWTRRRKLRGKSQFTGNGLDPQPADAGGICTIPQVDVNRLFPVAQMFLGVGDGFQFVRRHESAFHHLQGLATLFPLTDGAGQHGPAAECGGEGIGCFALGREATEDGVLS